MANIRWVPELEQQLRDLWALDISAEKIAQKIGGLTRSAVIGKADRLGLPSRPHMKHRRGRPHPANALGIPRRDKVRKKRPPKPWKPVERAQKPAPVLLLPPAPLMLDLMCLESGMCRYPIGEGPYLFCGHPTEQSSYCPYHHKLCWVAPERRLRAPYYPMMKRAA